MTQGLDGPSQYCLVWDEELLFLFFSFFGAPLL